MKPARYRWLMRLSDAENKGRAAFERCRLYKSPKENNPFAGKSRHNLNAELWRAWERGFNEAKREEEWNRRFNH